MRIFLTPTFFILMCMLACCREAFSQNEKKREGMKKTIEGKTDEYFEVMLKLNFDNLENRIKGNDQMRLNDKYIKTFYKNSPNLFNVVKDYFGSSIMEPTNAAGYYIYVAQGDALSHWNQAFLDLKDHTTYRANTPFLLDKTSLSRISTSYQVEQIKELSSQKNLYCIPVLIKKQIKGNHAGIPINTTYFYHIWWAVKRDFINLFRTETGIIAISPCDINTLDSDGDSVPDLKDKCPTLAGISSNGGCPEPTEDDSDGDGVKNKKDKCPDEPGPKELDGCPEPPEDEDRDGDGTLDKDDGCPDDPNRTKPGPCGCGVSEIDSDKDGTLDCNDKCPQDSTKTEPGPCGCGVPEIDSDKDGTPDCTDGCDTLVGPENNKGCPTTTEEELARAELDSAKAALDKEGRAKVKSFLKITNSVASKTSNPTIELTAWNVLFDPKQSAQRIGISSYQRKNRVDTVLATNYLDHLHNLNYDTVNLILNEINILPQLEKVAEGVYLGKIRFLQIFDGLGAISSYCDATEKEVIVWLYKVDDKFEAYLGDIMPINGQTKFRNCKE